MGCLRPTQINLRKFYSHLISHLDHLCCFVLAVWLLHGRWFTCRLDRIQISQITVKIQSWKDFLLLGSGTCVSWAAQSWQDWSFDRGYFYPPVSGNPWRVERHGLWDLISLWRGSLQQTTLHSWAMLRIMLMTFSPQLESKDMATQSKLLKSIWRLTQHYVAAAASSTTAREQVAAQVLTMRLSIWLTFWKCIKDP